MRMKRNIRLSLRQEKLLSRLGEDYTKNWIDGEPVIYRDFGAYDVEISGGHRHKQPISIYVWQKRRWPILVEQHLRQPQDFERIKLLLDDIAARYMNKEDENND